MGSDRHFALYTDDRLKAREARLKDLLDAEQTAAEQMALHGELFAVQDEISLRQRGRPDGAPGMGGVREPRRPPPGGSAGSVKLEPDPSDEN